MVKERKEVNPRELEPSIADYQLRITKDPWLKWLLKFFMDDNNCCCERRAAIKKYNEIVENFKTIEVPVLYESWLY